MSRPPDDGDGVLSLLGNILWIVLGGGLVICVQYVGVGLALCASIVGIPWGLQAFKLAILGLIPFGRTVGPATGVASGGFGLLLDIVWLVLGGFWIWLTHLAFALLCAITIVGIPFALQHLKLAKLALRPFGRDIT